MRALEHAGLVAPRMWDLISLTRDRTRAPCIGSVESHPLDHQGSSGRHESSEKGSHLAGDGAENSWGYLSSLGTILFCYSICIPSACTPECKLQKNRHCVSAFIAPHLTPAWDCVLWIQPLQQRQRPAVVSAPPSGSSALPPPVTQLTQPCPPPSQQLFLGKALCLPSSHFISTSP